MITRHHDYRSVPTESRDEHLEVDPRGFCTKSILVRAAQALAGIVLVLAAVLFVAMDESSAGGNQVPSGIVSSNVSQFFKPKDIAKVVSESNTPPHKSAFPDKPLLALLISFANSGTSYTLKTLRRASNMSTASNYCNHKGDYIPVYDMKTPGPHIIPEGNKHHLMPKHYILTKTHCAHCSDCPPSHYIVTTSHFQKKCLTECYRNHGEHSMRYDMSTVGKVVHLFRDPFDNIISRFHCHMHGAMKSKRKHLYPSTVKGFQHYCSHLDLRYRKEEAELLGTNITSAAIGVPCHAEFYKYVQWHNHAFEMLRKSNISTHIVHYKEYYDDFNGTLMTLLKFLDMPYSGDYIDFRWSDYSDYYSPEQRRAVRNYVKLVASPRTWSELSRYFV